MHSTSWFSVEIFLEDTNDVAFNGFFSVNDCNVVTGFYETINGTTDFNNNLLLHIGKYTGRTYKDYQLYYTVETKAYSDSIYEKNWLAFDKWGVYISKTSKYTDVNMIKLRAHDLGTETSSNHGYFSTFNTKSGNIGHPAIYNIKQIIDPTNISYWYSIDVTLNDATKTPIFTGTFKTNLTYELNGFYETINGTTDFNKNLLLNYGFPMNKSYDGFRVQQFIYNATNGYYFDNAYKPSWLQFDYPGVMVDNISYFNNTESIIFCSDNIGDETITNEGIIIKINKDSSSDSTNTYPVFSDSNIYPVLFTIKSIISPM